MTVCVPLVNICEQGENFATTPEYMPGLQAQIDDVRALRDDAASRGSNSEVTRHQRVTDSIDGHPRRLKSTS